MQNYKAKFKNIIETVKINKIEYCLLLVILLIATFLRFYKIPNTLGFYGDEGRDALVVKRMIVDHKFTLIGPVTSVGNMYLGPLYYYMMIIPMILFNLNPVSAAYMVAFIGVLTVFLVYYLGRIAFGRKIGLLASFLYAISVLVIKTTRSSWNPNPMPFFSLILILSLYKVYVEKKYYWLVLTGISFAFALQMHYFGLILLPVIGIVWFLTLKEELKTKMRLKSFFLATFYMLLAIILLTMPLIIFDIRHDFINYKAVKLFFTERQPDFSIIKTLKNTEGRTRDLISSLFTIKWDKLLTQIYFLGILIGGFIGLLKKEIKKQTLLIVLWLIIGILGLASYYGDIYPHYLGFLFPVPFLLLAVFLVNIFENIYGKAIVIFVVGYFCCLNLINTPFKKPLFWNIEKVKMLSSKIHQDIDNPKFNIVWISLVKDYRAMNYRYFLEVMGKKPLEPEEYPEAEVLYIVVEDMDVNPVDYPIWEIQSFGKAKIEKIIKTENGPIVYKLVRK